jgi:polyisoprenoid-binding protein YceI
MKSITNIRRNLALTFALIGLGVLLSASAAHRPPQTPVTAGANEIILNIDPAQSTVHYSVSSNLHTVHGTFAVKRGSLEVDPVSGKASGEILVDAASGQSGNNSRDKKMHKDVLESGRFADIVFRPDRIEGTVRTEGDSHAQLHGRLLLHGAEHEVTVPVQAELKADQWKGNAQFGIPFVDWGMKNPSNFLLKLEHTVNVEVEMAGTMQRPSAAVRP